MSIGRCVGKGKELFVDVFECLFVDNTCRTFLFEALIDDLNFFLAEFRSSDELVETTWFVAFEHR